MALPEKRLKSEVEKDRASREFRKQRMTGLVNPCPVCHNPMVWLSSPEYEGWECERCGRKVAMGEPAPKADPAKDQEKKNIERRTIIKRFGDRRPGGCSSC